MTAPHETATLPVFVTWRHAGSQFLAVPHGEGFAILSSCGAWYGAWQSIEQFRKIQRSGARGEAATISPALQAAVAHPLPARAHLAIRTFTA